MDPQKETTEVRSTTENVGNTNVERDVVRRERSVSPATVAARFVWFIVGFISVMIGLRVILLLLAANPGNAIVDLIYGIGGFFASPFFGFFSYAPPAYGNFVFELSSLVAIAFYLLIGWGLVRLMTLASTRRTV